MGTIDVGRFLGLCHLLRVEPFCTRFPNRVATKIMSHGDNLSLSCDYCGLPVLAPTARLRNNLSANTSSANTSSAPVSSAPVSKVPAFAPSDSSDSDSSDTSSPSPQYCCFGCRFAAAVAQEGGESGQVRWTLTSLGVAIFFTMNVMIFTMVLWSQDLYIAQDTAASAASNGSDYSLVLFQLYRYLCLIFSLPVLFLLGRPLLDNALDQLREWRVTSDLLLSLGSLSAFAYSVMTVFQGVGHVYFDVCCMVLVALTLGRWLEATGKLRATQALQSLEKLLPDSVRRVRGESEETVPLEQVVAGDSLHVLSGQRIPLDGQIISGSAHVDQQVISGESLLVTKQSGDQVWGGTLNTDGNLIIRVTESSDQSALARLMSAVKRAALTKGQYQRLADRIAAGFVPLIIVLSIASFFVHWNNGQLHSGIMTGLAVLLIACPCALGLATPMAIWGGLSVAARKQILFQNGDALCRLAKVKVFCFDKTGTLTTGTPQVHDVFLDPLVDGLPENKNGEAINSHVSPEGRVAKSEAVGEQFWRVAQMLSAASTHNLSRAILDHASSQQISASPNAPRVRSPQPIAGRGIQGSIDCSDTLAYLGNAALMVEKSQIISENMSHLIDRAERENRPLCCVAWDGRVQGVITFSETLRDDAQKCIAQLKQLGMTCSILTGDHRGQAMAVARQLGIEVQSSLLPEEKQLALDQLRRNHGSVAMVGDGVNDAPALALADVGIALGCGADVSREAADVCLSSNELSKLLDAMSLSRRVVTTIRQNLFWAFSYNLVGLSMAVVGLLNPIVAAVAMLGSSFFVISNSIRLSVSDPLFEFEDGAHRTVVERSSMTNVDVPVAMKNQDSAPSIGGIVK